MKSTDNIVPYLLIFKILLKISKGQKMEVNNNRISFVSDKRLGVDVNPSEKTNNAK